MSFNLTAGNPRAHRIRVYFGNSGSATIYEGMPLCYDFDTTTNWFGGSIAWSPGGDSGAVTSSTTTAEGGQNEGKYIRVSLPDADNIHAFAGVVAAGGWTGRSDARAVDIFIPNGAIVPVRTDQNCTVGRTILALHTAEDALTSPYETSGRAVAIAWETARRDTTTGIVLAKLSDTLFIYQKGDNAALLVDDEDTGDVAVNQIRVDFSQASGRATAFQIRAFASAGNPSSWDYGLAMDVSADLNGADIANSFNGSGFWLNIGDTIVTGGSHMSALRAGIYEDGSDVTFTSVGSMAPLSLAVQFTTDPSGKLAMIYMRTDGSNAPDYFFIAETDAAVAMASGGSITASHPLKTLIGGVGYNILLDAT